MSFNRKEYFHNKGEQDGAKGNSDFVDKDLPHKSAYVPILDDMLLSEQDREDNAAYEAGFKNGRVQREGGQ